MDNLNPHALPPSEFLLQVVNLKAFLYEHCYEPPFRIFVDSSFFHHFHMLQSLKHLFESEQVHLWSTTCLARTVRAFATNEVANIARSLLHREDRCEVEHEHDMYTCFETILYYELEHEENENTGLYFLASQNQEFWKRTDKETLFIPVIYKDGIDTIVRIQKNVYENIYKPPSESGDGEGSI